MAHILVVDDDDAFRESIVQLLALSNHTVASAADGQLALRYLSKNAADLVLLDMMMPVKEGYETLLEIRTRMPHLPVIAMTGGMPALAPDVLLRGAQHFGAQVILEKPFSHDQLTAAVEQLLADGASQDSN